MPKKDHKLSFREQLETVSLQLFHTKDSNQDQLSESGLRFNIDYPFNPPIAVVDLPVAILRDFWAGYSCRFHEQWYRGDFYGLTPLDDFGIRWNKMINIWIFTFPLVAVDPVIYYVMSWLRRDAWLRRDTTTIISSFIKACKVYLFLDITLQQQVKGSALSDIFHLYSEQEEEDEISPSKVVRLAMREFTDICDLVAINNYCPIIEDCHEFTWLEQHELVLYPLARKKAGRWFYPLVPSSLFRTPKFKIDTWQFLT